MNLADCADGSRPDGFGDETGAFAGLALVAHLGGDFGFGGNFGHHPGFVNGVGERFLAVDMFAKFHRSDADDRVVVIGSGNHDGIDVLLLFEHFTVIGVEFGVREGLCVAIESGAINVAESDDVFTSNGTNIAGTHSSSTYQSDVEFFAGRFLAGTAKNVARDDRERRGGGRGERDEFPA